jgi:membrane-associated phospholipid phosphatase
MLRHIDHDIMLRLNYIVGDNYIFYHIANVIGNNPFFRGLPIFLPLAILWFSDDYHKYRSRMLIGLLATCLAVNLSVWMQSRINIHTRPFLDQTLPIKIFDRSVTADWDHLGSFPSDSATLFFSLVTIIFLERPLWGSIALLWSFVTVGLFRVALGWHYPSDIVGALVLGPGCVYLVGKIKYLGILSERLLYIFQSRTYIVHSMFVIFVAEAYHSFPGLQSIVRILKSASEHLVKSS